jgi:hypothetical protein
MRKVIDSSMLQSDSLRNYLSASRSNFAVLPDYVAIEAYKVDSVGRILERMQVLSRFPQQILVLKGTAKVCCLRGRANGLQSRLIDRQQTAGFTEYCAGLERARGGDHRYQRALLKHATVAKGHADELLAAVPAVADARRDIARAYTEAELRAMRTGAKVPETLKDKFVRNVLILAALMFRDHPSVRERPDFDTLYNRYIFRFALCCHIWLLDWVAGGSMEGSNADRIRNDMIDLSFAAHATYFDGLMTMDDKLRRIHAIARLQLETLLRVPPES